MRLFTRFYAVSLNVIKTLFPWLSVAAHSLIWKETLYTSRVDLVWGNSKETGLWTVQFLIHYFYYYPSLTVSCAALYSPTAKAAARYSIALPTLSLSLSPCQVSDMTAQYKCHKGSLCSIQNLHSCSSQFTILYQLPGWNQCAREKRKTTNHLFLSTSLSFSIINCHWYHALHHPFFPLHYQSTVKVA